MTKSLDELEVIKTDLVKKAIAVYKIGYPQLKNNFDNKKIIQKVLDEYRSLGLLRNELEKQMINQMITDEKHIPTINVALFADLDGEAILEEYRNLHDDEDDDSLVLSDPFMMNESKITPEQKPEIIEEDIEEENIKKTRQNYYCQECLHNHYYDSNIGKKHISNKTKSPRINKDVINNLINETYQKLKIADEYIQFVTTNLKKDVIDNEM